LRFLARFSAPWRSRAAAGAFPSPHFLPRSGRRADGAAECDAYAKIYPQAFSVAASEPSRIAAHSPGQQGLLNPIVTLMAEKITHSGVRAYKPEPTN
jgi:hypothetical protein